jgi:hypothetical protein
MAEQDSLWELQIDMSASLIAKEQVLLKSSLLHHIGVQQVPCCPSILEVRVAADELCQGCGFAIRTRSRDCVDAK